MPSSTLCPYLTQALGLVGLKFLSTSVTGAAEGPNEVNICHIAKKSRVWTNVHLFSVPSSEKAITLPRTARLRKKKDNLRMCEHVNTVFKGNSFISERPSYIREKSRDGGIYRIH